MSSSKWESRIPSQFFRDENSQSGEPLLDQTEPSPSSRLWIHALLLTITFLCTAWAGASLWAPNMVLSEALGRESLQIVRRAILGNAPIAGLFALTLMTILVAHELGHYLMARWYRVPVSLPYFIPYPLSPVGTFGAVILMNKANLSRKQLFDVSIAGPIAGLVVMIPTLILGLALPMPKGIALAPSFELGQPLFIRLMAAWLEPTLGSWMPNTEMNPLVMAAWAGCLVTGLNLIPISQLDGGAISYSMFGQHASKIAHAVFISLAASILITGNTLFLPMLVLLYFLRIEHPPIASDGVPLDWGRKLLGAATLCVPILCVPLSPIRFF